MGPTMGPTPHVRGGSIVPETCKNYLAKGTLVLDSEEAEVLACRKAMKFTLDVGFMKLVLERDNINLMKSISSPRVNRSRLVHIYEDVQCTATSFRGFISKLC